MLGVEEFQPDQLAIQVVSAKRSEHIREAHAVLSTPYASPS